MNHYEQKQAARKDRLKARAARLRREGEARLSRARDMASVIPFGQPILVGHHSEGRDRRYRAKITSNFRKGFDILKAADEAARRAASAGAGGISSDDPAATAKLREKLAKLEQLQTRMVLGNKLVRKGDKAGLSSAGFSEAQISGLFTPDCCGRLGFPAYALSNNGAEIRRLKIRIAALEKAATRETKETRHNSGVRIVENIEANRLQLFFDGKPPEEIRRELKAAGFRWAPSEGAWQRQLSNSAIYAANRLLETLAGA